MQVLHQNILSTLLVYECENWSLYATSPLTHYPHLSFTSASYELPQGWQILLLLRYVSDTQFCNIGVIIKQLSTYPVWRECCNIERYISSISVKMMSTRLSILGTRISRSSSVSFHRSFTRALDWVECEWWTPVEAPPVLRHVLQSLAFFSGPIESVLWPVPFRFLLPFYPNHPKNQHRCMPAPFQSSSALLELSASVYNC